MDKVGKDFVLGIVLDILTVKLEVFRRRTASYNNRKVHIVQHTSIVRSVVLFAIGANDSVKSTPGI